VAIEKMNFISIAGNVEKFDIFALNNILPCNIELVNAITIVEDVKGMSTFTDANPYDKLLKKSESILLKLLNTDEINFNEQEVQDKINIDECENFVNEVGKKLDELYEDKKDIIVNIKKRKQFCNQLKPMMNIDIDVKQLCNLNFLKYRFGSLPKESYNKLNSYIEKFDIITCKVSETEDKVYIWYFTPVTNQETIDSLLSSLYFKRIRIPKEVNGSPKQALENLKLEIGLLEERLEKTEKMLNQYGEDHTKKIQKIYNKAKVFYQIFEIRRFAVHSQKAFYLTGWIPDESLVKFKEIIKDYEDISFVIEDVEDVVKMKAPTKLKNNKIFQPFEYLVEMYGLPSYNEFDPTPFVAVSYLLMFGMMFGDIGQGLVLILGGYLFYNKTKSKIGKVVSMAGCSSIVFGFIYGSFFGYEELPHLINPMEEKYTILGAAVALGVVLILISMLLNIIISFKTKKVGKAIFDKNGIAGLIFYTSLITIGLYWYKNGADSINPIFIIAFLIIPLLMIFMAHPLSNIVENKKKIFPDDKGGFFIEAIFELIETLLSIMSNTISFVRVGAFALNHVGLFLAFHILAEMQGQIGGIVVNILGNILIIVLEGLIVGIQGLRLEYYEMFSRFFSGEGEKFKPFKIKNNI